MAPVHVAAATSNLGRLRAALDSGQPVDSLNPDRATPLMYGSFAGSMDIVTELIQRGADVRACDQVCHQNPPISPRQRCQLTTDKHTRTRTTRRRGSRLYTTAPIKAVWTSLER
jgi:ankyrin repeat protein